MNAHWQGGINYFFSLTASFQSRNWFNSWHKWWEITFYWFLSLNIIANSWIVFIYTISFNQLQSFFFYALIFKLGPWEHASSVLRHNLISPRKLFFALWHSSISQTHLNLPAQILKYFSNKASFLILGNVFRNQDLKSWLFRFTYNAMNFIHKLRSEKMEFFFSISNLNFHWYKKTKSVLPIKINLVFPGFFLAFVELKVNQI